MQLFFYALNFFLIIIEIIALNHLANGFFESRHTAKTRALITISYIVAHNLFLIFFGQFTLLKYIWTVLLTACWLYLTYQTSVLKCIFVSVFWLSFLVIIDSLFLASSSFFAPDASLSILNDPYAYYLLCYSSKILELLLVMLIRTIAKTRLHFQNSSWSNWLRALFFPIATLAAVSTLMRVLFMEPYLSKELFLCTFILLLADLMAIFLLDHFEIQYQTNLENTVLRQNLKLETEHIAALKDAYAEQRKQTHDFQNQLAVLHGLAKHNASQQEFAEYLEKTLSISFPATIYVNTNRLVVDIILSQRYSVAKNKGITFQTALTDLSDFPLPDDVLVVVLTNLIDNALEACEKLPEDKRSVLLKMQNTEDSAIIYIENPTLHPVKIRNNRIMTTKPNPISHGYGLKNVCTLLDQHNADYAMHYDCSTSAFCFAAQITY
jgi:hypothetical protein